MVVALRPGIDNPAEAEVVDMEAEVAAGTVTAAGPAGMAAGIAAAGAADMAAGTAAVEAAGTAAEKAAVAAAEKAAQKAVADTVVETAVD